MIKTLLIGSTGYLGSAILKNFKDIMHIVPIRTSKELINVETDFDLILIFSGLSSYTLCKANPLSVFMSQVIELNNILAYIDNFGKKPKIIYASSYAVHFKGNNTDIYTNSKAICEQICAVSDFDIICMRLTSIYTPTKLLDDYPMKSTRVYSRILQNNLAPDDGVLHVTYYCTSIIEFLEELKEQIDFILENSANKIYEMKNVKLLSFNELQHALINKEL